MNLNKKTIKFIEKAKIIHNGLYIYDKVIYEKSNKKICIIDPEYGEFWQTPSAHLSGKGNILRKREKTLATLSQKPSEYIKNIVNKRIKTNQERYGVANPAQCIFVKQKIKQTNLDKYGIENILLNDAIKEKIKQTNLDKYGYTSSSKNVDIKEKIKISNLSKTTLEKEKIKEKIKQTNLEKYGFSHHSQHPMIKEKIKISNLSKTTLEKEKIQQKIKQTILEKYGVENILKKINSGHLPQKSINIYNDINLFTNFMKDKTAKDASYELKYSIAAIHNKCKEYNIPYLKNEPQWEIDLSNWLTEHNINHIRNDRNILKPQEIDIYIPEYNIGIELCGLYWHSNLHRDKYYHRNKYKIAKDNNIQLIQIFEDEWVYKKEAVLNRLKNKLKLHQSISARKCTIKEIDHRTSNEYIKQWHTQGNTPASVRLGLYYQGQLVQVMSFGKGRFHDGWELIRLVSEKPVIGGANKLFKYFINKHNPVTIHSYCDLRWGSGDIYQKMGFEFIKQTEPDYFYVRDKSRINRINLQNHKLTEEQREIRDLMPKIYGVGHGFWIYTSSIKYFPSIEVI